MIFFSNIDPNQANLISSVNGNINDYFTNSYPNSMALLSTDLMRLVILIPLSNLALVKVSMVSCKGIDGINPLRVKETISEIHLPWVIFLTCITILATFLI